MKGIISLDLYASSNVRTNVVLARVSLEDIPHMYIFRTSEGEKRGEARKRINHHSLNRRSRVSRVKEVVSATTNGFDNN